MATREKTAKSAASHRSRVSTVRAKEFHFPVSVEWLGERRVAASVEGKQAVEVTAPPVFRGVEPET